jgi:hypothetical protein
MFCHVSRSTLLLRRGMVAMTTGDCGAIRAPIANNAPFLGDFRGSSATSLAVSPAAGRFGRRRIAASGAAGIAAEAAFFLPTRPHPPHIWEKTTA